ncbi:unnamed protein product [Zymoseptoria tritici ST99CH_3D7]|uniref:Fumarylacetoacetase n=1 Tax=Zymoseptoria tritici (strain ST99CH_3D7) TaxID=1276538 RepID=A0A1X7RHM5_ZYMT9|nr:unnamed protein product [Zymoseptoria tritici ST99CH_3D7]
MPPLKSWLEIDPKSHFSIHNIPLGIISTASSSQPRPAAAIGDYALDLQAFAAGNGFSKLSIIQPHQALFSQSTLNDFAALGRPIHRVFREYIQSILLSDGPFPDVLQQNQDLQKSALIPLSQCKLHLPMQIGDYTDFYAGLNHAYNAGCLFRTPSTALQPNYKHLPVGYHGRASSIVVSGTPVRRPNGQILLDPTAEPKQPVLSPSRKLDIELELGCFVCTPNEQGVPVSIEEAEERLFGVVLLNDWSARDIQAWEYVPLGPFLAKSFATTISPWVVLMDALEPFKTAGIESETEVLPYLQEKDRKSRYAIDLKFSLTPAGEGQDRTTLTKTSAKELLFSFPQMLAHHTVGGCPMKTGDLMGSGTISGTERGEFGSLLELTEGGKREVELNGGQKRRFLEDGDVAVLEGVCGEEGGLVGFGECVGRIERAVEMKF